MSKDKYPKPKKMSNKNLILDAIEDLKSETGFHFYDIKFGNGYFVFDYPKDSICWFKIKEIPGFRFAFWRGDNVNLEYFGPEYKDAELILFTQAELLLDKFKPSNSGLRVPMSRYMMKPTDKDWETIWSDWGAVQMLKFMKKHRHVAFYYSGFSEVDPYCWVSKSRAFIYHLDTAWYHYKEVFKDYIHRRIVLFDLKRKLSKLNNTNIIISDFGDNWSPRIHVYAYLKWKCEDKDIIAYEEVFNQLEDKYFSDVSFIYIEKAARWKSIENKRIKAHEKEEEVLLWKK